ncbi:MAG: alpha amylase C-terminal domain-containing protein, partial [Candidatus Binatia bacterium]
HERSLDWHLAETPERQGFQQFLQDLGSLYRDSSSLWRRDPDPESFAWIDCTDRENSVISYLRRDGDHFLVVVCNLTPVPHDNYRVGVPAPGRYVQRFSSDDRRYGGSEFETPGELETEGAPFHGHDQSLRLRLPPLGALVLGPAAQR